MGERYPVMPGGLLMPGRWTYERVSEEHSAYTEQGPRPGPAVPITEGASYRVQNTAQQGEDIEVRALRSGRAGTLGIGYRLPEAGDDSPDDWRGWNPPIWLGSARLFGLGTLSPQGLDAAVLPDSQVAIVLRHGGAHAVTVHRWAPRAQAVSAVLTTLAAADHPRWRAAAICVVPRPASLGGGRALILYGGILYSTDDGGDTLVVHAEHPIEADIEDYGRVRMEYRAGEILLLVEDDDTDDTVHQYASRDDGGTFDYVGSYDDVGNTLSIAATPVGFVVLYRREDDDKVVCRRLSSAYEPLTNSPEIVVFDFTTNAGKCAVSAEPDGTVWAHVVADGSTNITLAIVSRDDGRSWTQCRGYAVRTGSQTDGIRLAQLAPVWAAGQCALLTSWEAHTTGRAGLGVLSLGGWSTLATLPPEGAEGETGWRYEDRAGSGGWGVSMGARLVEGGVYLPLKALQSAGLGWGLTGEAGVLSNEVLELEPTTDDTLYQRACTAGSAIVLTADLETFVGSGGLIQDLAYLDAVVSDGTTGYHLRVRLSDAGIVARDHVDDDEIGASDIALDEGGQIVLWVTTGGRASVAVRRADSTRWEVVARFVQLDADTSSPPATSSAAIGVLDSEGRVRVRWLALQSQLVGEIFQPRLAIGQGSYGRILTGEAVPIPDAPRIVDSVPYVPWLRASGGVARLGDELLLPIAYDYGIHRAHSEIEPSPAVTWRTADTAQQTIVYDLGAQARDGAAIGLLIANTNAPAWTVEASTDASTWVPVLELDLDLGDDLTARLTAGSDTVVPGNSTASADRYLWAHELLGGVALVDDEPRRIVSQTAGRWTSDSSTARPRIGIELQGGESVGTALPLRLRHHSGVAVAYLPDSPAYRYWRIRVLTGVSPEGYWETGTVLLGRIVPHGAEVDLGLSQEWTAQRVGDTDGYGVTRYRRVGPGRREISLSWNDGQDRYRVRGVASPGWIGEPEGVPLVAREDVGEQLRGRLLELDGGRLPLVVIEPLPEEDATITDPTLWVYGTISDSVRQNQMAGRDWGIDEWTRVESVTITEVPGPLRRVR